MAYTDVQKAKACAMVRANKGVIDDVIIAAIRSELDEPKLPKMTIWRWWKHFQSMNVTEKTVTNVTDVTERQALDVKLEDAAHKFIDHALRDELLIWTSSKDAITAAAIAIDKMRLLRNLPTEIVAVLPNLLDAIDRKGLKASEVFGAMLEELSRADGD